ncbi:dipeptide epimerase [Kurthia sibirica]|uniref:Dipeptide epimerase n=1 Tax=Kurthia sibirica TaxID=202750 RepID=A0A2U3AH64_9BACL|nr:dipeptide epimerase [Kurthia sibirica]PWI23902.1 dipeptide epimerase [Kurthia sibirica]GEK34912.1 L-Ala-D/L-Glu epimerase [Kurthia sibirica]
MKITAIYTEKVAVPLKKPFKTALRTVNIAESIYITIELENGRRGFGEAPPTLVITGDSLASIDFAIHGVFKPLLVGRHLEEFEDIFVQLHKAIVRNTSAKAAVDMAIYDLLAQQANLPLFQYLGGAKSELKTDYTVSVNAASEMAADAQQYVQDGFDLLKIKVGIGTIEEDIARIVAIRQAIGHQATIRLDANQGWSAKDAVYAIRRMEDLELKIELVEQPVLAHDLEGLKYVTDNTLTPIMADESVFSAHDAQRVIEMRAADLINIKLMKAGGIHEALKINALAKTHNMKCMTGSMIETKIGITAAAHFAASQSNIHYYDFDAALMMKEETTVGGIQYDGSRIRFAKESGLGILAIGRKIHENI